MHDPKRILMIRPSALGDVCRSVPVLVSLRKAFPGAKIDWVVQDSFSEAIAAHPDLNEAIGFPRRRFAAWWRNVAAARELMRWERDLRGRNYDMVLDCQGLLRSGLMTVATGASTRIGHRDARELAWLAYNERVECPSNAHAVERMLSLLKPIDVEPVRDMRLYVSSVNQQWWESCAGEMGLAAQKYAVLAPTSRWASKRWPIERWRELIDPLRGMGIKHCIVIGAPGEESQVAPLFRDSINNEKLFDLTGKSSIAQTMAVIERAAVVIANDSAPLHMAVGFDVPCVGLFGPTNPEVVGPFGQEDSVVQAEQAKSWIAAGGNYRRAKDDDTLMRAIGVEDVETKIDSVLEAAPESAKVRVKPLGPPTRIFVADSSESASDGVDDKRG